MTRAQVYNQTGEKVTELDLNSGIFDVPKIDSGLIHMAVRAQLSNMRKPLAHTKMRGEVSGSGKKPWRQKGTGRARAGSIRSPLWRGGGITFGPRNERNYSLKLNRSAFKKALATIFTDKAKDDKLVIIEDFSPVAKTKELAGKVDVLASKAGLGKKRVLIIAHPDKELFKAGRNLKDFRILTANRLNVMDLLIHDILITKEALPIIEKTYAQ